MKRSEKMLAAGLVATLVLWQGSSLFTRLVIDPVDANETEIARLKQENTQKEKDFKRSQAAARKYAEWKKRSLPPDPVDATSLYQNWLIELATRTKLADVSVQAIRTADFKAKGDSKGEAFHVVSATLKAQATLEKLCDFLYEFRAAGLLHRVSKMTLTSKLNTGDPVLDIDLTVEGLSLKEAPPRSTLFSDPKLAELAGDKPVKARPDYDVLVKKNLFVRGYNGPPAPVGPRTGPGSTPEDDPVQFVRLVGSFSNGSSFDATMYDPSTNRETRLVVGRDFKVAGVEGKVVSVGIDFVVLSIKGETFRLELGDNLRQLKKLAAAEPSG
jgi:hypothetical protein